jgi:hypothetical protein
MCADGDPLNKLSANFIASARSLLVQFLLGTILSTDEKHFLSLAEASCICSQIERRIFFLKDTTYMQSIDVDLCRRRSTKHYLQILHYFFARFFLYKFSANFASLLCSPPSPSLFLRRRFQSHVLIEIPFHSSGSFRC